MELSRGDVFGDFRIVAEVGRGAASIVYEAEQVSLGRRVALKIVPPFFAKSPQVVERFRREAEAVAKLSHPHIVAIYESGVRDGAPYIAMELARGGTLAKLIAATRARLGLGETLDGAPEAARVRRDASKTLDRSYVERVVRLMIDALRALGHAHRNGVVHRDVKPPNILLDDEGRAKVADFGIARLEWEAALTRTGELVGSPQYMSPEQARGARSKLDHRSDLFSAGATLYTLLALRPPFEGDGLTAVSRAVESARPRPLRSANHRIPRDLETIVEKALEKNPDRRYDTAEAFAKDLERFLDYQDIAARPAGFFRRIGRGMARNKSLSALIVLLAAGGLALGAALVESLMNRAFERRQRALFDDLVAEGDVPAATAVASALLRRTPLDADAMRLLETHQGVRALRIRVDGAPASVFASSYSSELKRIHPPRPLGRVDSPGGVLDARLLRSEYVLRAEADDGRFAERTLSLDRLAGDEPVEIRIPDADAERGMVPIPAGEYTIGSDSSYEARPERRLKVEAFLIDRHEATLGQYHDYLRARGRAPKDPPENPDLPVTSLTFDEAVEFAAHSGKRLPTEAEWEAAARGPEGWTYPWGNDPDPSRFVPAGRLEPVHTRGGPGFAFGLHHMLGNAAEWTSDPYLAYPGNRVGELPADVERLEIFDPNARALRGRVGPGIADPAAWLRYPGRVAFPPNKAGLRCVRSPRSGS